MKPTVAVPESHRDLLARPIPAVLATMLPSGFPQAQPVRCGFDGTHLLIPTTLESAASQHMTAQPAATILIVDPDDTSRWIEIRGDADITPEDAVEPADQPTRPHTTHHPYHHRLPPAHQQQHTRVLYRIRPTRINLDAIHR